MTQLKAVTAAIRGGRLVIVVSCVAAVLLITPSAFNAVDMVKWTVVVVGAVCLLAIGVGSAVTAGRVRLPTGPLAWATLALLLALVAATLGSDAVAASVFGVHTRYSGLLSYAAGLTFFTAVLLVHTERSVRALLQSLVVVTLAVAVYAVLQAIGADPMNWALVYSTPVIGTLGNPNFVAGFLAIGLVLLVWVAADPSTTRQTRAAAALAVPVVLFCIVQTNSDQGVAAGLAGVSVVGLAVAMNHSDWMRRYGLASLGALAALAAVAGLAGGATGRGPLAFLAAKRSTELRLYYWESAWNMFRDNPVLGVGLDRYGLNYRPYRPVEAVLSLDLPQSNDAAHNVFLNLLAGGGVVLGVAYLALVGLVAWSLVRGLRVHQGSRRVLLGGVGGAWVAYQVQSLVSIDVPPLLLLHWVLAGAVVVVAGNYSIAELDLPWDGTARRTTKGRRKSKTRAPARVGVSAGCLLALVGLWGVTLPLRADLAAGTALRQGLSGNHETAIATLETSTRLAPWETVYFYEQGRWALGMEDARGALRYFDTALERSRGDLKPALIMARAAGTAGFGELAQRSFEASLVAEPRHPDLKVEYAEYLIEQGEHERARDLLRLVLEIDADHPAANALLAAR